MGLFGNKKKKADKEQETKAVLETNRIIKNISTYTELVNHTCDPDVFFPTYKCLIDDLKELAKYESMGIFSGSKELPSLALKRISSQYEEQTNVFIDRTYENELEQIVKTDDILLKAEKKKSFFENMDRYLPAMLFESSSHWKYKKEAMRWDEKHSDKEYIKEEQDYFALLMKIREKYSVLNSVGSFSSEAGDFLIATCEEAVAVEAKIKEKREYYENISFDMSEVCYILSMIYEKREEYENSAKVCVYAINNGYTSDRTKGGMRGRLARIIKKGKLQLTDEYNEALEL